VKVLVVEDDAELAAQIGAALAEADYTVETALDGEAADFLGAAERPAAAVLDLGLPGKDGIAVLKSWRAQGLTFPVLILTARDAFADKVAGFRAGADDYVLKPFRIEEVVLRLAVLLRRASGHAAPEIAAGALVFDTMTGIATLNGLPLRLTAFETKILRQLMLNLGRTVSRTDLAEQIYDGETDRDFRSLEVLIGRLRQKIGEGRIETRRGEGWRLLPHDPA
jgi:two-component system OmpR family response regulator